MPTLDRRSEGGSVRLPCRTTARFLWAPTDLILNHRSRPEVPALYAALARLCEVAKGPVEVSRTDLARWCGAEREDATGVAIEKAIWRLRDGGWLIQTPGQGRKRRLLVAWGIGIGGHARPWRFDRPDRGRPAAVQVVAIPLALFDCYLGRLTPNPHDPAVVDRYFERPLLDFDDIGLYASRQLGNVPVTPRLTQLGLVNDQGVVPPQSLDELLALAVDGQLTSCAADGSLVAIRPSPAGEAQLRKRRTPSSRPSSDVQHGSLADPAQAYDGSADGSADTEAHGAPQGHAATTLNTGAAAWDEDGKNQITKRDPSPTDSPRDHTAARAGASPAAHERSVRSAQPAVPQHAQAIDTCASSHVALIEPLIVAGHQALNTERAISAAEWWGLLTLQQQYGHTKVLTWQLRAAGAGRSEVRLAYYLACAADAALLSSGGHKEPTAHREAAPSTPGLNVPPAEGIRPQPCVSAQATPAHTLDRNRALLVTGIERITGRTVRHPELLAEVPLLRLARWREIAGHPGLGLWHDPLGYLIAEAAAGHEPPPRDELEAWAKRAGVHWLDPRLTAADDEVEEWEACDAAASGASLEDCHAVCPDTTAAWPDLTAVLREALLDMLPRRYGPLLDCLVIQVAHDEAHICCADQAIYDAVWDIQGAIRDALLDLGLPDELRIAAPVPGGPAPPYDAFAHHPDWIDTTTWLELDGDLRAALQGSTLAPDGGLDVRADRYEVIRARFASPVHDLLTAAQARASPHPSARACSTALA